MSDARQTWAASAFGVSRRALYCHVPFCRARCAFCGFFAHVTNDASLRAYADTLVRELTRPDEHADLRTHPLDAVYFGGGTPTDLAADDLARLVSCVRANFTLAPDAEFTIEGRLTGFTDEKVSAAVAAGANRFSFGVQSFDTALRQSLARRQPRAELLARLARIKEIAGDRAAVVCDLIYGLPGQTEADFLEEIRTVTEETPLDGVDLYKLKVFPGLPLERMVAEKGGWTKAEHAARHERACAEMAARGWTRLSEKHWGRTALERNRYNTIVRENGDVIPYGCGAGGFIGTWVFMQHRKLEDYTAAVEAGHKGVAAAMPRRSGMAGGLME